jgi:hypothetical protein
MAAGPSVLPPSTTTTQPAVGRDRGQHLLGDAGDMLRLVQAGDHDKRDRVRHRGTERIGHGLNAPTQVLASTQGAAARIAPDPWSLSRIFRKCEQSPDGDAPATGGFAPKQGG